MTKVNPTQLQKFLFRMDYPCSKQDIIHRAKSQGADDNVMKTLKRIPDENYQTPADISQAIGKIE